MYRDPLAGPIWTSCPHMPPTSFSSAILTWPEPCALCVIIWEDLPAKCIVHCVPVKLLLCRHYPMLRRLSFLGVSEDLAAL